MASFEKCRGNSPKNIVHEHKLPLKRFEPAIYRFTKIAIPTDLDRLERHKYNIEKYVKWQNWSKFDVERINAERTIKQLKANIQDMNNIREQVADNEVEEFDNKIQVVSNKALDEIHSLQELIQSSQDGKDMEDDDGSLGKLSLSPQLSNSDFPLVTQSENSVLAVGEMDTKSSSKAGLQRFDVALHTFTRITIPTALDRLRKHCLNMEKYYEQRRWRELNAEQVNAGITVQVIGPVQWSTVFIGSWKHSSDMLLRVMLQSDNSIMEHLKKSIEDIEVTRNQVPLTELVEFDQRVGPSYDKALAAVDSFMKFQKKYKPTSAVSFEQNMNEEDRRGLEIHEKLLNQELTPDEETIHSWDDLQKNLVELNELIHDFSHLVHEQQSAVDTISSNIEHAQVNVHEATQELGRAAKIQGLALPIIGAVVGGVVGGPVGLLAGFKAATVLTAAGGGLIGYKATNYYRHKRDAVVDCELEKLTDRNHREDDDNDEDR